MIKNKKGNDHNVDPWISPPDPMADPMTSGYSSITGDIGSFLVIIIVFILPVILCVIALITGVVQETIDANKELQSRTTSATTATATASKETPRVTYNTTSQEGADQSHSSHNAEIDYETVELFGNMVIDVPKGAEKIKIDEGICYATADGSLRVLVVEIPDPDDTYPENIIAYCNQKGIDLKCIVDPEGAVSFYGESVDTDDDGNKVYVDEEFPSYAEKDYMVRVESKKDDDVVRSHIINSLASK